MISFDLPGGRFNHRVASVCIHDHHVLLTTTRHADFWFLPGGRVELQEDSETALRREMREEINSSIHLERLLWIVEIFFDLSGKRYHQVSFVYEITPEDATILDTSWTLETEDTGVEISFRWFPLDTLEAVNLKPAFLREVLNDLLENIAHLVVRE